MLTTGQGLDDGFPGGRPARQDRGLGSRGLRLGRVQSRIVCRSDLENRQGKNPPPV